MKVFALLSAAGLLAGLAASLLVTPRFVSRATMAIYRTTGDNRSLRDYFNQMRIEVLSLRSLSRLIQDPRLNLYPRERVDGRLEDVIENARSNDIQIVANNTAGSGKDYLSFEITFACSDRIQARDGAQGLITRMLDWRAQKQYVPTYVMRQRSYDQISRMEARIAALEKRAGVASATGEQSDDLTQIADGLKLDVIDPPSLPVDRVYPKSVQFMAIGIGAGLATAFAIAFSRRTA